MNTESPESDESQSPDIQTDDVQVQTKRVPNKRICAYLIDLFIIDLAYVVVASIISGIPDISLNLLLIAYLLVRDALIHGQSIGKYAVGLKVVDMEGQPCNFRRSGLRNLIFIVPLLLFGIENLLSDPTESTVNAADIPVYIYGLIFITFSIYVIEYFVMRSSKWERRLGDRMAGTRVLDIRPNRPDWWFLLISILVFVSLYFVGPSMAPPSTG